MNANIANKNTFSRRNEFAGVREDSNGPRMHVGILDTGTVFRPCACEYDLEAAKGG